jgi:PAS domain S-box-containing protein
MIDIKQKKPVFKSVIGRKLLVYILLFSSIITFIGTGLQLYMDYDHDVKSLHKTLDQLESSYLDSIANSLWVTDDDLLKIQLEGILKMQDIQFAGISKGKASIDSVGTRPAQNTITRVYPLSYRYDNADINLGELHVVASLDEIYSRIFNRILLILSTQTVKTFLVSLFVFYIFFQLVGKHVFELASFVESIDLNTVGHRSFSFQKKKSIETDELDRLADAFNRMVTSLSKAMSKITESEKKYRDLVDNTPDIRYRADMEGKIVYVSPSVEKLAGFTAEEAVGMKLAEEVYVDPEARNILMQRLKDKGAVEDFEAQLKRKDGSIWWASTNAHFYKDNKGKVLGVEGVTRDISDRKHVEMALIKSEERLKIAAKSSKMGFWEADLINKTVWWDENYSKLFGSRSKETEKSWQWWAERIHPDDRERVLDSLNSAVNSQASEWICTYGFLSQQELYIDILDRSSIERSPSGEAVRVVGAMMDISEIKRNEEKYKTTIESAIDGFWMLDTSGHFLEVNNAYAKMTGYTREELLSMSIPDMEAAERPEEIKQRIEKIIRIGSDRFESRHRQKNGRMIDVEISATYTQSSGGLFFVFIRDITDRIQMEERLRQAQKMESIGSLAGGIAHDFNNLLFPILGMSEMLLEDLPENSLEHENAREIFHACKRAGDLVKQILAFSRQSEHKMTPVRIQNILKEVLKLSRSTIPTNIEIHEDIQQNCGLVMADATQVHQVAMNLITNAFHAVENTNGIIDIKLIELALAKGDLPGSDLRPGQYVRLSVSDNGVGIPQHIISKIFEPYFTTKKLGKGTGLGLAVAYGIVKEHKGEIKVYSEDGKGTAFHVYLPMMKKILEKDEKKQSDEMPIGTERILLVDDEISVAKLEGQMLSRLGYQVTVETASQDALNTFKTNPDAFDLVLSDMAMPDMTGDQLAEKILSVRPETPIIICTGFSERINKEKTDHIGVKGLLMKPVVKSDLAQMIRNVLDESKTPDGC